MSNDLQKVILLTGASTGLGLTIAKKLIKENYHLVLTARATSMERFKENGIEEADNIWLRHLDVTDAQQRVDLIIEINQRLGGVDILINNAGFTFRSVVEHVQEDERMQQMDTNFLAPMELTRLVLPFMRGKREGKIINISSVGGMMAMPTMAIYSASKWALEGSTESLWYEVKPWNIKVTLIQPGFINSDSFKHVRDTKKSKLSKEGNDTYHNHYRNMSSFIERVMKISPSSAEDVADKTLKVIKAKNPPLRVAGTLDAHLFSIFRRIIPRRLYHLILYYTLPGIHKWGKESND
ncbi:MAG: short-subunit dehydrogenase [Bacteriovoracaceae bacterium]